MSIIEYLRFFSLVKGYWLFFLPLVITCQRNASDAPDTLFREVPPSESGVAFANMLDEEAPFNIIEYLYYYNGGGIAIGDVNNDSLPDLYFTANQGPNALYLNRGDLQFEELAVSAGVAGKPGWSTGVTMADVNADGWLDIYVCRLSNYKGFEGHNELFINNQDGTFREAAAEYGLDFSGFSTQAAFFDYDGDGDLDCYLLNHSVHAAENYRPSDIRQIPNEAAGDRILKNESGRFRDVTPGTGIYSSRIGFGLGVATGDINGDGCPDIYVSNDFHENDYLYYNNCDGTFREGVVTSLGHTSTFSMGSDLADFNNDGRLDLLTLDMKPEEEDILKSSVGADPYNIYEYKLSFGYYYQYPRNMLQWNRGNLQEDGNADFSEIGQLTGVATTDWSWAPLFCDLDGDGWKDLFISNGIWRRPNDLDYLKYTSNQKIQAQATDEELVEQMPPGQVRNYAFRNSPLPTSPEGGGEQAEHVSAASPPFGGSKGGLSFVDKTQEWGLGLVGCSTGAAYGDLDGDGDLDLVLNNLNRAASIYENRAAGRTGNNFVRIKLRGLPDNPFGIGARVTVEADGHRQVQELYTTRGFQSAVEPVLTFGLGTASGIDRLTVRWPWGAVRTQENLPAAGTLVIHPEDGEKFSEPGAAGTSPPAFEAVAADIGLRFRHSENELTDFDKELLLPHKLSTQGPRLAVADVDGDGRDDVYICGARGQAGALYRQTADGRFAPVPLPTDRRREEVDAVFFDANGDGAKDLYIVSGGGEFAGEHEVLPDQLLINDGSGNFRLDNQALPPVFSNGSCAVPLDYNGDGALDLFLGSRSRPGFYGISPASFLLENDGQGRFTDVTAAVLPDMGEIGMVTDAVLLAGVDEQRLAVVGEWMPVTLFTIRAGKWTKTELPYSEGWWNAIAAADIDADGDEDLLLGNLGLNADLKASREEPVELYVKDFDKNLQTDPILTYYKKGKRYPYATFDELSMQLTILRKRYTDYREFAESTFEEIFPPEMLEGAVHRVAYTFASSIAINRGEEGFELHALPMEAQVSPLYAFDVGDYDGDGHTDLLATGNFYDSRPGLGRYDASYGHFLRGNGEGAFSEVPPSESGFVVLGQGRDLASVRMGDGTSLTLVARNNGPAAIFRNVKVDHSVEEMQ